MKFKNLFQGSAQKVAFIQITALVIYITFVAFIMLNGESWFGHANQLLGTVLFLLLFVTSAVISATIVLGRFAYFFWEKNYARAFTLLGWNIFWALFYIILTATFIRLS